MVRSPEFLSLRLERALRRAADWHRAQVRKGSGIPYIQHPLTVALILDRLDFDEDVIIAGLLHDAVEDTTATLDDVRAEFGDRVAEIVRHNSEIKHDATGQKRPWIERKRDHLEALADAPIEAWAVALADKLHNLISIKLDLAEDRPVWSVFNAERDQVLWYYRTMIDRCGAGDLRLERLAESCRSALAAIEAPGSLPADG